MSAPRSDAAAGVTKSSDPAVQLDVLHGPRLAPPVIAGPIAASSLGGIPFIAINGPVHQFSGKQLTELVLTALKQVGVTIRIPD